MTKWCSTCAADRPIEHFNARKATKDGYDRQCRDCINAKRRELRVKNPAILERERQWRAENPEKWREYQQRDRNRNGRQRAYDKKRRDTPEKRRARADRRRDLLYGLSPGQYNKMLARQCGLCAICQRRPSGVRPLVVDHCHDTGNVRWLLCDGCNAGLGFFDDDLTNMTRAIRYLEVHGA